MTPRWIEHVTLDTGDRRRSPRGEVADEAIAALHDGLGRAIAGARVAILGTDCAMTATAAGKCLVATAWAPGDAPLVTVGVAARNHGGARLWAILHAGDRPLATSADAWPAAPWVAARFESGLALYPRAAEWLGDWERCLAWTWLGCLG